ncbi:hypothetical protein [Paludisphaera sp.]|uniref:hypothetical protein n=1 Tax=Paludisphaera sp. TaxID=2017432 RepID=UPI00301DA92F
MDPNPPRTRPARQRGGADAASAPAVEIRRPARHPSRFEIPVSAIAPLFRARLARVYRCRVDFDLDIGARPTARVLGGYYRSRRLVRVYANDRDEGRRPLEELFDTFLHEVAHHLEYTEPDSFSATACGRVPGRMHSRLFWRILGELKYRWICIQDRPADAEDS